MAAMRAVTVWSQAWTAAMRSAENVAIPQRRGTADETNAMRTLEAYSPGDGSYPGGDGDDGCGPGESYPAGDGDDGCGAGEP